MISTALTSADAYMTMIRQETIFCKLIFIKLTDLELLQAMQPSYKVCPTCGAKGCCNFLCTYTCQMITIENGCHIKVYTLTITRVM